MYFPTIIASLFLFLGNLVAQTTSSQQQQPLPTPPHQNSPWPHNEKDAISNAAATLFAQGLPDPRHLPYHEIEIIVGNPWDGGGTPLKTHGWVLPQDQNGNRFAIAWNGLLYPLINIGSPADLQASWSATIKIHEEHLRTSRSSALEDSAVQTTSFDPIKIILLLRLGEVDLIQRFPKIDLNGETDPYLSLAHDWTWNAFERAVTAHMRGDDHLALADAQWLTKIQPVIEAEAQRRGFELRTDHSNSRFPDRKLPYLPFLKQLPELLNDAQRRIATQQKSPPPSSDLNVLIADLQNVNARQFGQPGGVSLASDPRIQTLIKRGAEIVEPLVATLENDTRLTRSVSFGRDFMQSRYLISVSEAAHAALEKFLGIDFESHDKNGEPLTRKQLATNIRDYWIKVGNLSPAERYYATLKDDQADKNQWLQAAAHLVQPVEFSKPDGPKIGDPLRDQRTPSVSQLLAKRSDDIAAIRTGSTNDHFLYLDASNVALYLAEWDKTAAITTLNNRLQRAWNIGKQPNDILAFNGNPAERFGAIIAKMTMARVSCGDESAYDEYASWIQTADIKRVGNAGEELLVPLVRAAQRPSIKQAIEQLFARADSPLSNILVEGDQSIWSTSLPINNALRAQAFRALSDKTDAGQITFNPKENWNGQTEASIKSPNSTFSFRGSNNDPHTPPAGQPRSFRTCDLIAYFYFRHQGGPTIQLFWPEQLRDTAVSACIEWLKQKP